jgi:hypothetical protein
VLDQVLCWIPAVLMLAGCAPAAQSPPGATSPARPPGTASSQSPPPSGGTPSAEPSRDPTRTLRITVAGGDVEPPPARVRLPIGTTLRLVVTVDHADELHVHGFDSTRELGPGRPATLTLTGRDPGVYEVELHEEDLQLVQLVVR